MSELEDVASGAAPASSAGTLLRQAREAAGMHVAALAVALKVPVSKLEALEADRYDQLPDAVFVRALASSVCRTLRIEAAPVLALLPQTGAPRLGVDDAGINTPFREPHQRRIRVLPEQWFSPTLLAVPLLCVGALAIYLWPRFSTVSPPPALTPPSQSAPATEPVPAEPEAAASVAPAAAAADSGSAAASAAAPASALPVAPAPAPVPVSAAPAPLPAQAPAPASVPTPAAASVAATPTVTPAAPPAATPAAAGVLSFSATASSWIKVTDATGQVTFQKTLSAGESATAGGQAPLNVVVGRADATQVQVRGKAFDLQAVARENVARFEVK